MPVTALGDENKYIAFTRKRRRGPSERQGRHNVEYEAGYSNTKANVKSRTQVDVL